MQTLTYSVVAYGIQSRSGAINRTHFFSTYHEAYAFCCEVNRDQEDLHGWVPVRVSKLSEPCVPSYVCQ